METMSPGSVRYRKLPTLSTFSIFPNRQGMRFLVPSLLCLGLLLVLVKADLTDRHTVGQLQTDWPRQWRRERSQRMSEPIWKLSNESLRRIEQIASSRSNRLLSPVDGRIVICQLLNSFRGIVFPNPLEMHSGIKYGIRPLLYSILRREFFAPRNFAACANTRSAGTSLISNALANNSVVTSAPSGNASGPIGRNVARS